MHLPHLTQGHHPAQALCTYMQFMVCCSLDFACQLNCCLFLAAMLVSALTWKFFQQLMCSVSFNQTQVLNQNTIFTYEVSGVFAMVTCLSVRPSVTDGTVSKQLNLSENIFDHLVAPS